MHDQTLTRAEAAKLIRDENFKQEAVHSMELRYKYVDALYAALGEKALKMFVDRRDMFIETYVPEEDRKDEERMTRMKADMLFCYYVYGADFDEYFLFDLEYKPHLLRDEFLTQNHRKFYAKMYNLPENNDLFRDKDKTAVRFKEYYHRDVIAVCSMDDLDALKEFAAKHDEFIVKPRSAHFGMGVRKAKASDFATTEELLKDLIAEGEVVVEELIKQSNRMGCLHPQSVNTVRLITVLDRNGECQFFCPPFLRMGQGDGIVDNAGAGGVACYVDIDTGRIYTDGADEHNNVYKIHPDTGIRIKGWQVPDWEEAKEFCRVLANVVPENRYCGWDLALTDEWGWIMVEGNDNAQYVVQQMIDKVGKKQQLDQWI